jgi:hypothetical protein
LIDEGTYTPPEPYDDLALARELALELYQQGKTNELEPEKLELLRTFLGQLDQLQAPPPAPAQAPQPAPAGAAGPQVQPAPPVQAPPQLRVA